MSISPSLAVSVTRVDGGKNIMKKFTNQTGRDDGDFSLLIVGAKMH